MPGPACYGRGGTEATVTDANLVLGYLDPEHFLGGRTRLDRAAAEPALDRVAEGARRRPARGGRGVHRVVNTNMAEGIRLVSVRRGVDPRRFALLSFGGAAGLHVDRRRAPARSDAGVVPRVAAVLSAWGMLATDLRFEVSRTHIGDTSRLDGDGAASACSPRWSRRAPPAARLVRGPVRVHRSVDMRYGEQIFEITVPLDDIDWTRPIRCRRSSSAFHHRHEELYTYALRDQEAVLVNARAAVIGVLPDVPQEPNLPPGPPRRRAASGASGWAAGQAPVFDFDALAPGQAIAGPAIVESAMTTVLLRPGDRAR